MKILVSGGSGLLGQAIVNDLLFKDDEFIILTRNPQFHKSTGRITYHHWNPYIVGDWQSGLDAVDVVLNLAGENIGDGFWSSGKKERILSSRVSAGQALANAINAMPHKPRLFIQASAVGYYGNRQAEFLTEASQKGSGFLSDVCQQWEASSKDVENLGIRRIILRTGVVLSNKAGILPRMSLPIKLFLGGNLGNGKQFIPWLHVDDFPAIIHFLIHQEIISGVVNACAVPVSFEEFGKLWAKLLHRPYWLPVPGFVLKLMLREMSALVLDSQRVMPQRLQEYKYLYRFETLESALKDFA